MKATPASPKSSTWLGLILFLYASALTAADLFNATTLNAGAVRVLCLPVQGDPLTGSGFTLAGGTHLVTNWHVVACTQAGGQVRVLLDANAGEMVTAEVRGRDEARDLTVLRLARPIRRPDARFATLATLAQRDPVIVVGFPGDADEMGGMAALSDATLTEGVVGRLLPSAGPGGVPLVQVSAAINPGNSGGPLLDEAGRVVGIVTLKSLATVAGLNAQGDFAIQRVVLGEGLGWAVASDALLPLLERLDIPYQVSHGRLSALGRWWYREPALVAALGLVLLALGGVLALLLSRTGRARVQERLTRITVRRQTRDYPKAPVPVAVPPAPGPALRAPVLRGLAGPYAGQTISLAPRPVAIGRDPALAQLVIPADQVGISQRHALVGHDSGQGGFYVEDCWSTNGVFLLTGQGKPLRAKPGQAQPLAPGARFYLATPAISFEVNYQ